MAEAFRSKIIKRGEFASVEAGREKTASTGEDEKKIRKDLSPEAKYVLLYTKEGGALIFISENPGSDLAFFKEKIRTAGEPTIKKLERAGLIKLEQSDEKSIIKINSEDFDEKLKSFFPKTKGAEILKLFDKGSKMTAKQISAALGCSFNLANDRINAIRRKGLLDSEEKIIDGERVRVFFMPGSREKTEFVDKNTADIFEFIKKNPGLNLSKISSTLSLSRAMVQTRIYELRRRGLIEKIEKENSGYYYATEFSEMADK